MIPGQGVSRPPSPQGLGSRQLPKGGAKCRGRWKLGVQGPLSWCPPQQLVDTRYLSKGRGLPRRLVTTATQCWDARTYTLCWADCSTCSSRVSCSLERSTLMISGTCGWWVRRQTWKQDPGSQVLSMGPWEGAAQELQGPSWGWGGEGSLVPSGSVWSTEANRPQQPLTPYLGCPSLRRSDQGEGGQWAGMEEREGEADRSPD